MLNLNVLLSIGLIGLIIGSVLNMIIYRLPIMLDLKTQPHSHFHRFNLFVPRSHCINCAHMIPWYHNIPIFSFIINRGRCAYCHAPISWRYPLIELSYALLLMGFSILNSTPIKIMSGAWFLILIMIQIWLDLELMLLPDLINYLLLWSGLIFNISGLYAPLDEAVLGSVIAYLGLWGFYHLFAKITGKQGFGYGDFKLYAAIAAWIGLQKISACIIMAATLGILFALFWKTKKAGPQIPFGPALAISGLILLAMPPQLFTLLPGF